MTADLQKALLAPRPGTAPALPSVAGTPPPHNLELERILIGDVLLVPDHLALVVDLLRPEDFFAEEHQRIWQGVLAVAQDATSRAGTWNLSMVAAWLHARGWYQKVGGAGMLAKIVDEVPATGNVRELAEQLVDLATTRTLIGVCDRVRVEGYFDVGNRREWLSRAAGEIAKAVERRGGAGATLVRDALRAVFEQVTQSAEKGTLRGIPTGYRDLDRLAGPVKAQLVLIGALSSVGKTSFARCLALAFAMAGVAVLIFSLEMDSEEMSEAMLYTHARVDGSKIDRKERLTDGDWQALVGAAKEIGSLPIWIDDRTDLRPFDIQTRTLSVKAEASALGFDELVVMVDYVQIVNGRDELPKNASREQEIGYIGRALKNLSQRLRVPIFALSQLNDEYKKRGDKEPEIGDLRESRGLTQAANRVILLHNPAALARAKAYADGDRPVAPTSEMVDVIVAKNRGGRTGRVRMVFFPYCTLFADHDGREETGGRS